MLTIANSSKRYKSEWQLNKYLYYNNNCHSVMYAKVANYGVEVKDDIWSLLKLKVNQQIGILKRKIF